eukprot:CAMPEP_0194369330 /NCGR_PEP_ID=MMETSP0174-20130528/17616_1 /TAXON_ID=216777 /ORGANISM="Proboscia alata, Strain PI-D3" /LENGTH=291 /DNA_ID=CAMNT_0039146203 /DNA_START=247 /DNA_END=1122 /DNA_ORIENTATION=+
MPENVKEHEDTTSQISVSDNLMDVFPLILDYLYGVYNHKLRDTFSCQEISERLGTAEKYAMAILSLARYFAIKKLIKATETIILVLAREVHVNVVGSLSRGESISFMLSQAIIYSEGKMADVLIDACAREHAVANPHVQKMMMRGIPPDLKIKILELSHNYIQEKFDMLVKGNTDKNINQYKLSQSYYSVSGAGVESANGVYRYIGKFTNDSMYSMCGTLDGHDQVFSLYSDTISGKINGISVVIDDWDKNTFRDIGSALYRHNPRTGGWVALDIKHKPPPTNIKYVYFLS